MSFLIVKSVPLQNDTCNAWRNVGGTFLRRRHGGLVNVRMAENHDFILNLGNVNLRYDGNRRVYNRPNIIRSVSTPIALRRQLQDLNLLPEHTTTGPHWHKGPGFAGENKIFHEETCNNNRRLNGMDVQAHIVGNEYRVISVGNRIVQAHRKLGDVQEGFDYEWVGVEGVREGGFIPTVKQAVESLGNEGEWSVFGWDIIHDGTRPWILECNTSPGVNEHTARRIVNAIS